MNMKTFLKIRKVQRESLNILRVQQLCEGKSKQIFRERARKDRGQAKEMLQVEASQQCMWAVGHWVLE